MMLYLVVLCSVHVHVCYDFCCDRILDDVELYEQSKPLPLSQLCDIGSFLNSLIVKVVWEKHIGTYTTLISA